MAYRAGLRARASAAYPQLVKLANRQLQRAASSLASGFGLLEAIVALALLSGVGIALFSWIQQNLQAASQLEQVQARALLQMQAQSLMNASVNPHVEPRGERRVGDLVLNWTSELESPIRTSLPTQAMEPVRWRVGLYRVQVQARRLDSSVQVAFQQRLAGLEDVAAAQSAKSQASPP